jgi:hypothetical protein
MAYKSTKTKNPMGDSKKLTGPARNNDRKLFTRHGFIDGNIGHSSKAIIALALAELITQGYSNAAQPQTNVIRDSEALLNDLGFIPVESEMMEPYATTAAVFDKDFSLLKTINVDTTIKNSKIFDPDIDILTPEMIIVVDKFKSETDPFYELDDVKPDVINREIERQKRTKNKKLIKVATKLTNTTRKTRNKMLAKKPIQGTDEL